MQYNTEDDRAPSQPGPWPLSLLDAPGHGFYPTSLVHIVQSVHPRVLVRDRATLVSCNMLETTVFKT